MSTQKPASTVLVRSVSERGMRALREHAAAAGVSAEAYMRTMLERLADTPVDRDYRLVCSGGRAYATLAAAGEIISYSVDGAYTNAQHDAVTAARELLTSDRAANKSRAIALLAAAFASVVELPA
jgi:negative regulator of replication initiation